MPATQPAGRPGIIRSLARTNQFKKDYKRALKRGYDESKLQRIVERISKGEKLEQKHQDHPLTGEYSDCRECHVEPGGLLIYRMTGTEVILIRTGTHADLFE